MKYLLLLIILCIQIGASAYTLPDLEGDNGLSPWQEHELGEEFFKYVKTYLPLVHDPLAVDYINQLGFRLVAASEDSEQAFYFFIVKNGEINAFAGPGGYVGINAGLILFSETEGELASVIAHEISHVTQHHFARAMEQSKGRTLATVGAMLAAIFIGNPDLAAGAATGGIAGTVQSDISYTQSQEKEADRAGIALLYKAGFDPNDMAQMFALMQKRNYDGSPVQFEFLSDHPFFSSRIADAQALAAHYPARTDVSSLTYFLVQARLACALTADPKTFLKNTDIQLKNNPTQPVLQYAHALAFNLNDNFSASAALLQHLIEQNPDELFYPYTLAEVEIHAGQLKAALSTLKALNQAYPDDYAVMALYGQTLITAHRAAEAARFLKDYFSEYEKNINYLELYSQALGQARKLADAYQMRARAYVILGQKQAAIAQIETALQLKNLSAYDKTLLTSFLHNLQHDFRLNTKPSSKNKLIPS